MDNMKKKKMLNAAVRKWANQEVIIKCKMNNASDLMNILFMMDNRESKDTLKINHMTHQYRTWLNKMVDIVCEKEKNGKS